MRDSLKTLLSTVIKSNAIIVAIVYTLSWGLICFNKGIYWDDWIWFNVDHSVLLRSMSQAGFLWFGWFHNFMLSFQHSILLYRCLVFFSFFVSAFLLYAILKTIKETTVFSRFFIVTLFSIFPVNNSRVALSVSQYALCYALFFAGFWLLSRFIDKRNIAVRVLSLLLLFLSFTTNSFLVFYCVPIGYLLYREKENIKSPSKFIHTAFLYLDYFLLPFLFWFIKQSFFVPYGIYKGYNNLQVANILQNSFHLLLSIKNSFFDVVTISLQAVSVGAVIMALLLFIFFVIRFNTASQYTIRFKTSCVFFVLGIGTLILSLIPYVLVGQIPSVTDWNSRHQLLVPLGACLILFYGVELLLSKFHKFKLLAYCIFIALFVNLNIHYCLAYQKDWYKQVSLREAFKESKTIKDNTMFVFTDETTGMNANDRIYRSYEYTGIMAQALNEKTRLGFDIRLFNDENKGIASAIEKKSTTESFYRLMYLIDNYVLKDKPDCKIQIKHQLYDTVNTRSKGFSFYIKSWFKKLVHYSSSENQDIFVSTNSLNNKLYTIDTKRTLSLLYYDYFNHEKFLIEIKKLITLDYLSYTN